MMNLMRVCVVFLLCIKGPQRFCNVPLKVPTFTLNYASLIKLKPILSILLFDLRRIAYI